VAVVDARVQEVLDVYESHSASFEDSATITRGWCMMRHILRTDRKSPQHGFWGRRLLI